MKNLVIATALMFIASNAMADPAGLKTIKIQVPHHEGETGISIWYPIGVDGKHYASHHVLK